MKQSILSPLLDGTYENAIFPFLWLRGEPEEVLREEIAMIDACGIKAVCLESRPHPDFCGEGWWKDFDIVLGEAKARGMKIWILDDAHFPTGYANGRIPEKYPERARQYAMIQHTDVTGPLPYAELDIDLMMTKRFTWMDFGKPREDPLVKDVRLLSVMAARVREGDRMEEVVDLTDRVKDGKLLWDVPAGVWRILISFTTYDFGARGNYINYIDRDSVAALIEAIYEVHYQHYPEEFGRTIAGFFSDEPGFYNTDGFTMDESIGRKVMPLPWNRQVPGMLEVRLGSDWKAKLPLLWYDSANPEETAEARYAYMDTVSLLYKENFSEQLGDWCRAHGVEYIGHVLEDNNQHSRLGCGAAHYFRAMAGQDMAGIDNIGGQILPGNPAMTRHGIAHPIDGEFCHYALGKMGASAAQTDPKKKGRLMCETYGAYGWNLGVKGMKWITDYLLLQGVNRLVPHAFSMKEYPDDECPPHFYARGKNPQFPWFAELMKYANRMCTLLDGGQNVPAAAILYHGEMEWVDDCMMMQKPARELLTHQIDFEFIPTDALTQPNLYGTQIREDGLTVNGRQMRILIVPECRTLPAPFARALREHPELPVVFVNRVPERVAGGTGSGAETASSAEWLGRYPAVPLADLAAYLGEKGIGDVRTASCQENLGVYHYRKNGEDIYFLMNTDLGETIETEALFPMDRPAVRYDGVRNRMTLVRQRREADGIHIFLSLRPYQSMVLVFGEPTMAWHRATGEPEAPVSRVTDLSAGWQLSLAPCGSAEYEERGMQEILKPVSLSEPLFSGLMRYEKKVEIAKGGRRVFFRAEYIYESAELLVNGISAGKILTPPYEWEITSLCRDGENTLCVIAANTPTRDSLKYPCIFGPEREVTEPSGMFGHLELLFY